MKLVLARETLGLEGRQCVACELLTMLQAFPAVGGQPTGRAARKGVLGPEWSWS